MKAQGVISVKNLQKSYKKLKVLKGISFDVNRGKILALLGPNGAGKTTTIKILSTLLLPDGGHAKIDGIDVVKKPDVVKSKIGLTGQFAAVDEYLSGIENLEMIARLYRLSRSESKKRAAELIEQFDLVEASKRIVKTYSGGMRRRLDLAMSIISTPQVIFLDEPTTGLDPRSRLTMWEIIKKLKASGTTILLTTQYMEEADQLADRIIVIDEGKVIAEGTADVLKKKVGSDMLQIVVAKPSSFEAAKKVLKGELEADPEERTISIPTRGGIRDLKVALYALEKAKIEVESISLHRPTLDDVFLSLTGHKTVTQNGQVK